MFFQAAWGPFWKLSVDSLGADSSSHRSNSNSHGNGNCNSNSRSVCHGLSNSTNHNINFDPFWKLSVDSLVSNLKASPGQARLPPAPNPL